MEPPPLAHLFVDTANFGAQDEIDTLELKGANVYGDEVGLKLGQGFGPGGWSDRVVYCLDR